MDLDLGTRFPRFDPVAKRDQKIQLQACEHDKNINRFRLSEKLEHANQLTSRHVYELDALTTKHCMTN